MLVLQRCAQKAVGRFAVIGVANRITGMRRRRIRHRRRTAVTPIHLVGNWIVVRIAGTHLQGVGARVVGNRRRVPRDQRAEGRGLAEHKEA